MQHDDGAMAAVPSPFVDMYTLDPSSLFYSEPEQAASSMFAARGSRPTTDCTADLNSTESAALSAVSEVTGLVSGNVCETYSQTVSSGDGDEDANERRRWPAFVSVDHAAEHIAGGSGKHGKLGSGRSGGSGRHHSGSGGKAGS